MRRLAIIASIIGAVAFAALLAWGLTFSSGVVQADDETPTVEAETPTVEADETPTVEADETPTVAPEYCGFAMPTTFAGTVTVDGVPAADGTTIEAIGTDGVTWGTATTSDGSYNMEVPATPPTIPPCFPGGTISFTCDGASAAETGQAGMPQLDFDLTCGPLATPEPSPTVEPTPEVTPTVLPPTGMGGMSGDGGFMWWPLALAAAALTSVAGLFTARWARR